MDTQIHDPMLPHLCRIVEQRQDHADTFTLTMQPVDGASAFAPGQFNMLYVFGVGEIPISVSGDPTVQNRLVHTTRSVGTVTSVMSELHDGDMLGVRGPFGNQWPVEAARGHDVVLIAGGIGLAPLRPALYELLNNRGDYGKIVLLYGARTQEEILYREELEQWRARFDMEVYVTVDRATGDWHGNVGVVTTLVSRAPFAPDETVAMICGPEVMMRFTVQALQKRGLPVERTYVSMERNMKCGVGICGRCQYGPFFICRDGPVFRFDHVQRFFGKWEV